MKPLTLIVCIFLIGCSTKILSQINRAEANDFVLKGQVLDAENDNPIPRVNIEVTGKGYSTTNRAGEFQISAQIGDELVIRSDDFKTIYHTVKDQQRITVKVEKAIETAPVTSRSRNDTTDYFKVNIDSAKYALKNDAKRSIDYVNKALESVTGRRTSQAQSAIAFETLGDINLYWQLPDLAVSNYKESIRAIPNPDTRIKLAKAFMQNNNYQESIAEYKKLLKLNLSFYQRVEVYEGLGDNYMATNDAVKSVFNYQKGLDIANKHTITPKITDLNSKIGGAYAQGGAIDEAEEYFGNSLTLSKNENKKRAVEEKNKVADFYNQKQDFTKEIELRQEALDEIESFDDEDNLGDDLSSGSLSPQRQNYKIANAYVAQDKYEEAIPFLERSISEADAREDLVVQKDATRKLSEIYRDIGDYDKASAGYQRYVEVVDELYIKKEQELSQAKQFSKEIALKQNRISSLESERAINESRYKLASENQELIQKNNQVQKWIIGTLIVIALLLLYTAYNQRRNVNRQKYANNQLALKSLRTQMNPHFIFNALNSVNSFIASNDERAANKYLSEFSQLMRSVLENSEEDFIPLSKEIELLQLYVKLEHFRFNDKFDYSVIVDERINIDDFVIPPMLLQPYVENAVWHGLRYKEEKGKLEIDIKQIDTETVAISITDDGIGRKKSKELKTDNQKKQNSKGMGNIQRRISILNEMYQDKVDVTVENVFENEEGTRVRLILKKD